jgi:hypothetical protein
LHPPSPSLQGYDFSDDSLESKALPHTGDYQFRQKGEVHMNDPGEGGGALGRGGMGTL